MGEDADVIRLGAEKQFNTTKATLLDQYKSAVADHKTSLDKKLELFEEEKHLVELIRGKVRELGPRGPAGCVGEERDQEDALDHCICVPLRGRQRRAIDARDR